VALRKHVVLAPEHGIAIHRAILKWVRSAMAALGETADDAVIAAGRLLGDPELTEDGRSDWTW
jgi:hypothetical protein